jgi:hypothetical protein
MDVLWLKQLYSTMAVKLDYKQERLQKTGSYTNEISETIIRPCKIGTPEKSWHLWQAKRKRSNESWVDHVERMDRSRLLKLDFDYQAWRLRDTGRPGKDKKSRTPCVLREHALRTNLYLCSRRIKKKRKIKIGKYYAVTAIIDCVSFDPSRL